MELNVVIVDTRPWLVDVWKSIFGGVRTVTVMALDSKGLGSMSELDAEVLPSALAHQKFGGKPKASCAQILSGAATQEAPSWVITIPPVSAHLEERVRPDGGKETVIVPDVQMSPDQEVYWIFEKVFRVVSDSWDIGLAPVIHTLGFSLELLDFPQGDPTLEAQAVLNAYQDVFGSHRHGCQTTKP